LEDVYFAENKIVATLPKMHEAAKNAELKAAFEKHLPETKVHVALEGDSMRRQKTPSHLTGAENGEINRS
jgi:ferritin-like metal-binding protein YciE